jgi:hypothetical protein
MMPYSKELGLSLMPEEEQVIDLKYKSKPFGGMTKDELFVSIHLLLTKIQVITGWDMPPAEKLDILIDQTARKFIESYPTVNADEMEYAFRNNGGVQNWGKSMNLNLIDEVMSPYLQKRKDLSRMEEEKKSKQLTLPAPEITDDEFIESVKISYQATKSWKIIPVAAYNVLYKSGKINLSEEKRDFIIKTVDEHFPEATEKEKTSYCKSYSVMLHFEGL